MRNSQKSSIGQSEVVGVILILGITFTGISIILVTGNPTLDDTKDLARTSAAENSFSLLDERMSSAALSRAKKKRFTLNLQSGEMTISPDDGEMRIYSSPPALVWSESPGASDATHVLNFTVVGGSELVGNDTNPRELSEITVRYPPGEGFNTSGVDVTDVTDVGIDTDADGSIDKSLSVSGTSGFGNLLNIQFSSGGRLNETDLITLRYDDVVQPARYEGPPGVRITVRNDDGDSVKKESNIRVGNGVPQPVTQIDTEIPMGKIEYETSSSVIAYQNGGVWTKPKDEDRISRVVSKPEVYYEGNTLTASVINLTNAADISLGGNPSLTATNTENVRIFPEMGTQRTNPLQDRNVYIDINTTYYNAWSSYFESETVGDVVDVKGDGDRRTVAVELSPLPDTVFNQAILARNGNLTLTNTSVDSYDSAVSDYSPGFRFGNADIGTEGNVSLENRSGTSYELSRVYGDVMSNDSVIMQNRTVVNGNIKAYGYPGAPNGENISVDGSGCRIDGTLVAPGTIGAPNCPSSSKTEREPDEPLSPLITLPDTDVLFDDEINQRISDYSDEGTYLPPDNAGGGPITVSPGNYYVNETSDTDSGNSNELDWDDETVRFNTEGGPINIAVSSDSDAELRLQDMEIEVEGDNRVRIYSGNTSTALGPLNTPKILFDNVTMDTPEDRGDLFSLFVHSTDSGDVTNITFEEGAEFYGSLYAPDTNEIQVSNSDIHGAMVVGEADIVDSGVHYDQQLRDPAAEGTSAVNYLHVTDNRVRVR